MPVAMTDGATQRGSGRQSIEGGGGVCHGYFGLLFALLVTGCGTQPLSPPLNPFTDLPPVALDGRAHELRNDIVPLGDLRAGEVWRVRVDGGAVEAVLLLTADEPTDTAGAIAGGGPGNEAFDYPVQRDGRYFAFVRFDPALPAARRTATITVGPGDPAVQAPAVQWVRVEFEAGYLTDPGLFDPVDGRPEDRAFLEGIRDLVRLEVVNRLRTIFADTPIVIVGEDDPPPAGLFSRVVFRGDRVLAENQDAVDAALPPPDPTRPQCQQRVIFGEVLPRGAPQDWGNRIRDDQAVVYVGSFQGRGEACWTSAVNSLNNVVLALAQTGAHEIGHLVGLQHVEQIDIMNRSATLAFLRELEFTRSQVQFERRVGNQVVSEVLTTIVQDPDVYFRSVFQQPDSTE